MFKHDKNLLQEVRVDTPNPAIMQRCFKSSLGVRREN